MRGAAMVVGGLLLVGGGTLVVVADIQRTQALDQVQQQVRSTQQRLDASRESNHRLAEQLTALRSRIYEQDAQLSDTTGFLK